MNHKLFHPRLFNIEYFYDAYPIDINDTYKIKNGIKNIESSNEFFMELFQSYNVSSNFYFLRNMQTVDFNGSIRKLEKWIIESCWNIMNQNEANNKANETNNKANKKKSKLSNTIVNCSQSLDISGGYNLQYKHFNIKNIKSNYTPNENEW
jgi:hypothetical protein